LRDEHLLRAVDDEVSAGVKGTLVQLRQVTVSEARQETVGGAQHDGDFADERLLVLGLHWVFIWLYHSLCNVHIQWRRVPAGIKAFYSVNVLHTHILFWGVKYIYVENV